MGAAWEGWFTVAVVVGAFACLLRDVVQPDHVMIGALTILMAAGVVSVEEGLAGFSNEGLLTVATLFVVAAGISATGGLDWYMSKLLGKPRTIAGAQMRLMVPIALVSGFLNNTPVVAVMIPIVQRWAENIRIPKEQVMIPLSFASILGGTCTLIGTSTNLVVLGMLQQWRGADGTSTTTPKMGLFDLGLYGIPCALTGMTYMLLASRALLPKGRVGGGAGPSGAAGRGGESLSGGVSEDLIVKARLQPWSAAVGKTVGASGLRGLPGLYLVSVRRDDALMRAVGPDFVLAQGDVLLFTGMVESLGRVCAEHGLEAVTAEHDSDGSSGDENEADEEADEAERSGDEADPSSDRETDRASLSGDVSLDAAERGDGFSGNARDGARPDVSHLKRVSKPARDVSSGGGDLNVPAPVPEMSELREIQMMARSQAIGGGADGGPRVVWSSGRKTGSSRKPARSNGESHSFKSDRNTSEGGETSATSGGESEGFDARSGSARRAWSDGDGESDAATDSVSPPEASSLVSAPDPASGVADPANGSTRLRKSLDVRRAASDAAVGGETRRRARRRRPSDAAAEFASAVAVDPGERRALRLYDRRRRDSSRRRARNEEMARDAAMKALGPPRVTVEPDPEARDGFSDDDDDDARKSRSLRTVLGVSATDRPGLLHDISQGLNRLRVQLLHCEASVVANRSVSIWRLRCMDEGTTREEIRTVIDALLSPTSGSQASKEKGQSVLRVRVRGDGALVGRASADVQFRATYGAAIVAIQRGGRAPGGKLGQVKLREGDVLVLQCNEDSPLLADPPAKSDARRDAEGGVSADRADGQTADRRGTPTSDMPSTPHGSKSSLMSMVGMKDLGKDLRGYSLRSRGTPRTPRGRGDTDAAAAADPTAVAIAVLSDDDDAGDGLSGADSRTSKSGSRSGSGSGSGSPGDRAAEDGSSVSVAIPDIRGMSLRALVGRPASTTTDSEADAALRIRQESVRKAHADLEVVGADASSEAGKEFLIAVRVERRSQFIKKTADEAGLRQLPGLFLVSIERRRASSATGAARDGDTGDTGDEGDKVTDAATDSEARVVNAREKSDESKSRDETRRTPFAARDDARTRSGGSPDDSRVADGESVAIVDPSDDALREDDVLWYAGNAGSVASLRKIPGLAPYSADQVDKLSGVNSQERRLIQAVVAKTGPLVGKSIREMKFRTRYNAVVLAVHREGARVHARIGDVILHPGDVLLLDAGPDFHREAGHSGSGFALVSVLEDSAPPRLRLLAPVLVIAVAMIAVYTAGVTELLVAAVFAAAIMIACGALSEQEARDAIKWDVIVTIAAAFGMSKALQNSGVAGIVAKRLVRLAEISGTGRVGLLVAVYVATFVISNVVTNNAAAALMFPIAAEAAEEAGETLRAISFLVMLAASASFMSPFGYQTNLMVYGPGGYVFADFLRFGVPMQVVQMVVSVAVIALGSALWWVSWAVAAVAFGAACAFMMWEQSPAEAARACLGAVAARARAATRTGGRSRRTAELETRV